MINDKKVIVDQVSGIADISNYLKKGENKIKVNCSNIIIKCSTGRK